MSPVSTAPVLPAGYGQVAVAITPIIPVGGAIDEDDFIWLEQFADFEFRHPLSGGRTSKVVLNMDDPAVEGLEPWQQALRVLYYRPGEETAGEPIFWGQTNVSDDFTNGKVTLEAQDPSVRCLHHYLRIGDDALNDPVDDQKGKIRPDHRGIEMLIDAAQAPGGPPLGLSFTNNSGDEVAKWMGVERSQEVWALILEIAERANGPDFDLEPFWNPTLGFYSILVTYDRLGRDLTATVTLDYGDPTDSADSLSGLAVTPGHPSTHHHVVDRDREWRATGTATAARDLVGTWVDWVATDVEVDDAADVDILRELAKARARAYGFPPKDSAAVLRSDPAQAFHYGSPFWEAGVNGDTAGDFYVGDTVQMRAKRGHRELDAPYRIREVVLAAAGPRGAITTGVDVIPVAYETLEIDLEVDET